MKDKYIKTSTIEDAIHGTKKLIKQNNEECVDFHVNAFTEGIKEILKKQPIRTKTDEDGFYVYLAKKFLAFNNNIVLRDTFMNHLCEEISFLIKDKLLETMDRVRNKLIKNIQLPDNINGQKVKCVETVFKDEIIEDICREIEKNYEYNRGYETCLDDFLNSIDNLDNNTDDEGFTS